MVQFLKESNAPVFCISLCVCLYEWTNVFGSVWLFFWMFFTIPIFVTISRCLCLSTLPLFFLPFLSSLRSFHSVSCSMKSSHHPSARIPRDAISSWKHNSGKKINELIKHLLLQPNHNNRCKVIKYIGYKGKPNRIGENINTMSNWYIGLNKEVSVV